jgi:hypothetical protein
MAIEMPSIQMSAFLRFSKQMTNICAAVGSGLFLK